MSSGIVSDFDAYLSAAERALLERARDFARRAVAPYCAQWQRDRRMPIEALRAACAEGLAGVELPVAHGGLGMRFSAKLRMVEELARFDFAFPFSLVNHHNAMNRIAAIDGAVAARLLPKMLTGEVIGCSAYSEPDHGSDLASIVTLASKADDGGWRLDGRKAWITNAAVAGVAITLAQTAPGARGRGLASFVVEAGRPGFVREGAFEMDAGQGIGAGGFRLENYRAEEAALVDPPGKAFSAAMGGINGARTYVAAMCAGMLAAAIDLAVDYGLSRQAFGQPLAELQGWRWSLVHAETDLAALRLLTYRAARLLDAGAPADEDAARAKKFAGDRTVAHLSACIQAMGANGLRAEYPLVRHLGAAKIACFTDGATEMMNERLAKLLVARHEAPASGAG